MPMFDYVQWQGTLTDGAAAAALTTGTSDSAVVQDGLGTPTLVYAVVSGEKATYAYLTGKSPAFLPNPIELPGMTSLLVDGQNGIILPGPILLPNDTIIVKGVTT